MKKLICGLLAALCLTGCAAAEQPNQSTSSESTVSTLSPTPEPATEPEPPTLQEQAQAILADLTREEIVGQLFLVRYPETNEKAVKWAEEYHLGGYILFGREFKEDTPDGVREKIAACQQASSVPMLISVDEEGGTVVRASRYPAFRAERFASPQRLFRLGGMEAIRADAAEKSTFLKDLGINVNLAPVCDLSTNPEDFIYDRAFGQDARATADYIAEVVSIMKAHNMGSVLKHFPGYGDNADTHTGSALDERPLTQFQQEDLLPFRAGVEAGAGAVLVSHNIVTCLDETLPASLSPAAYSLLRQELGFDGVAITDDLDMEAVKTQADAGCAGELALMAGADMVITGDPEGQICQVLAALEEGRLDWNRVREAAARVLCWKLELELISS